MINDVFHAIHTGDDKQLQEFLVANSAFANMENNDGLTPLGYAAHYGQINMVKLLLNSGAEVNAISHSRVSYIPSNTALHAAIAGERSIEVITTLLQSKALTDILDNNGQACLHVAAFHDDNVEIIKLLIDHGADVSMETMDGRTAQVIAKENGNERVAKFLEYIGALNTQISNTENLANLNRRTHGTIEEVANHVKSEKESWRE